MKHLRPKFSLLFLVLISLFIPSIVLVWLWREPWVLERIELDLPATISPNAPDGVRQVIFYRTYPMTRMYAITENGDKNPFYVFHGEPLYPINSESIAGFLDNDHLCMQIFYGESHPQMVAYLTRRFPEWWWGHFYRPEVWLALAFGVATLVSLFKTKSVGAAGALAR